MGNADFTPVVRSLILMRAGGACEVCGAPGPVELHHRKYKSRGGLGSVENGTALCGWGNHTGHHGWAHTAPEAHEWGVSLHSWQDPLESPLWDNLRGCWVALTEDGRKVTL